MNGSRSEVDALLSAVLQSSSQVEAELAVFPPSVYLQQAQVQLSGSPIALGAQNVCANANGAYTGEQSVSMLVDAGCQYVIVGHSERRQLFSESNDDVANKFHASLVGGLRPILCVGETLEQREAGSTLTIVQEQLAVALSLFDNPPALEGAVVAYEPVWAIGTGRTASPEQAQEVHKAIRDQLGQFDAKVAQETRILYGGSVKPDNAAALFQMPDIDGALVGGASLDADKFLAIGLACNN